MRDRAPRLHQPRWVTGLLMASGNDCAMVIAANSAASINAGKDERPRQDLGALDTRAACHVSGLDAPARIDVGLRPLAVIFRAAMRNETFREIIGKRSVPLSRLSAPPEIRTILTTRPTTHVNVNNLLSPRFPGMLGGKTGTPTTR